MVTSLKLEEICTTFKSDILVNKIEKNTGEYPVFGAKGIVTNIQSYQQSKPYISIIKWGAGVGRAELRPAFSSIVATMLGVIPNENIDLQWLCYLLQSMHLEQYATNAVVPNLYFKDYCTQKVSVPDYLEQKEISQILGNIQQIIKYRKNQLETLEYLIKARFVELFSQGKHKLVKASEICDFITKGTTPPTGEIIEEYGEGMIPFLKVYNLSFTGEMLFDDNPQYIPKETHNGKLARSKVYPNDVLMNIVGPPLGKFTIVTDEYEEWNINQAIAIFRAKEHILPRFLLHALMQPTVLEPFIGQAVGIRQQNLSLEQCRNLQFPLPSIEEQQAFVKFAEQIDKSKVVV